MFVFRPHVHQLDGTITPDLLIDQLRVDGRPSSALLSEQPLSPDPGTTVCAPALVLVGAGYGSLLAPAWLVRMRTASESHLCLLARTAWRLADVLADAGQLVLELRWPGAATQAAGVGAPAIARWSEQPAGTAVCWSEPSLHCPADAPWCSLQLHDPVRQRVLSLRLIRRPVHDRFATEEA